MKRVLAAATIAAGLAVWSAPAPVSAVTGDEKLSVTVTNSRSNPNGCDVKISLLDADERSTYTVVRGSERIEISTNRRGSYSGTWTDQPRVAWSVANDANVTMEQNGSSFSVYSVKVTDRCN